MLARRVGKIPDFTAPEVILQMGGDPMCSDVWSCGVVLYVMLCGRYPFTGTTFNNIPNLSTQDFGAICGRIQGPEYVLPPDLSDGCCDLIRRCLVVNPENRVTIAGILSHLWFREALPENAENMNDRILEEE